MYTFTYNYATKLPPFFDAAQTPPRQTVRYVDVRTFHHTHLEREGSGIIIERRRRGFGNLIRPFFGGAQIVRATSKGDTFAAADDKDVLQNARDPRLFWNLEREKLDCDVGDLSTINRIFVGGVYRVAPIVAHRNVAF